MCDLHTNKLPLCHLIIYIDGKTKYNNKWSGDLGKKLDDSSELPVLNSKVVHDLSTDLANAYKINDAINNYQYLKQIVEYIMLVYLPNRFNTKIKLHRNYSEN